MEYRKRLNQIKGEPLYRTNTKNSVKIETEIEYCTPRLHTGNGVAKERYKP